MFSVGLVHQTVWQTSVGACTAGSLVSATMSLCANCWLWFFCALALCCSQWLAHEDKKQVDMALIPGVSSHVRMYALCNIL